MPFGDIAISLRLALKIDCFQLLLTDRAEHNGSYHTCQHVCLVFFFCLSIEEVTSSMLN